MIIVPGPASESLGIKVAASMNAETVHVISKVFPDGESYIRLTGKVQGEDVAVIQTAAPHQNTCLFQLLQIADLLDDLGAKTVIAVMPYFAYARQSKRSLDGEAVSVRTIIKLIETVGVDEFVSVNVHNLEVLEAFSIPAESLSAVPVLASYLKDHGLKGVFSLAPDDGAAWMAADASKILGGGHGWLEKKRDPVTGEVAVKKPDLEIAGKDLVVIDDIISTGETTAKAVEVAREQGARHVYAACVHPLMVGDALSRIRRSGAEMIIGTDSVESDVSTVTVAPLVAGALMRRI